LSTGVQRRQTNRKRADSSVVRVRLKDKAGNPRWATAYLRDVTEEGVGLSLMTPLEIGSMVVLRGTFGEGRADVQLQADVKWCTAETGGVYQVGLELKTGQGARAKNERREADPPSGETTPFTEDPDQSGLLRNHATEPEGHGGYHPSGPSDSSAALSSRYARHR
jgi:hypothetical protein